MRHRLILAAALGWFCLQLLPAAAAGGEIAVILVTGEQHRGEVAQAMEEVLVLRLPGQEEPLAIDTAAISYIMPDPNFDDTQQSWAEFFAATQGAAEEASAEEFIRAIFGSGQFSDARLEELAARIEEDRDRYLPGMLELLGNPEAPEQAIFWVIKMLVKLRAEEALPLLVGQGRQAANPAVRAAAIGAVASFRREEDLPLFRENFNHPVATVRRAAMIGLERYVEQPEILDLMFTALGDSDWFVRLRALETLRRQPELELTDRQRAQILSLLDMNEPRPGVDPDDEEESARAQIRRSVASYLSELGDEHSLHRLETMIVDPDAQVRFVVTVTLARLNDPAYAEALSRVFLDRDNADTRRFAIEAAGRLGDMRVAGRLIECLKLPARARPLRATRDQALRALQQITGQSWGPDYRRWKTWWENTGRFTTPGAFPAPYIPPASRP